MAGSGGPRQGEGSELDILMIAGGIFAAVALIYYLFHVEIIRALFFIKYYELTAIDFFVPALHGADAAVQYGFEHPSVVTLHELFLVSNQVGDLLKYPLSVISLIFAAVLYLSHPDRLYNDIESMETLNDKLVDSFPATRVVQGLDLVKTPIDKGPWAMAQTPVEWAKSNKLLARNPKTGEIIINNLQTKMLFTEQLGKRWKGIDYLTLYEKAIFAALCAYVNYDRKAGEDYLEQLADSATQNNLKNMRLKFDGLDHLIKKYSDTQPVQNIISNHAYVYTVFAQMLEMARETGIVANSMYLWLKPIDRKLWYTLNSVGRKAVFTEVGGIFAHWHAEKKLKMSIAQPIVEEAVHGLEEAIKIKLIKDI